MTRKAFLMSRVSLATANKGLDACGTAPSGRRLRRQPGSSTHANKRDGTYSTLLLRQMHPDKVKPKGFSGAVKYEGFPALFTERGQGTAKRAAG